MKRMPFRALVLLAFTLPGINSTSASADCSLQPEPQGRPRSGAGNQGHSTRAARLVVEQHQYHHPPQAMTKLFRKEYLRQE